MGGTGTCKPMRRAPACAGAATWLGHTGEAPAAPAEPPNLQSLQQLAVLPQVGRGAVTVPRQGPRDPGPRWLL